MSSVAPNDAAGCDDFQLAVEMRLHGALDEAAALRLDEHLAGCATCRAFSSATRGVETTMGLRSGIEASPRETIRDYPDIASPWRRLAMTPLALIVGMVAGHVALQALDALSGDPAVSSLGGAVWPLRHPTVAVIAFLGLFAFFAVRHFRDGRRGRILESTQENLLGVIGTDLERQIRLLGTVFWFLVSLGILGLASTLLSALDTGVAGRLPPARALAAAFSTAAVFLGPAVYLRRIVLPRLRRERAAVR